MHTCLRLRGWVLWNSGSPRLSTIHHVLCRGPRLFCVPTYAFWSNRRTLGIRPCYGRTFSRPHRQISPRTLRRRWRHGIRLLRRRDDETTYVAQSGEEGEDVAFT